MEQAARVNHITRQFYNVRDSTTFHQGIQTAVNEVSGYGLFTGDNLFTYGRNLSFLEDQDFMRAFDKHVETEIEKSLIWRNYVLAWAAKRAMNLPGDFADCGCYKGITARILCDYINFGESDKQFYLYDLFEHEESMDHHSMPEHSDELFDNVRERFSDYSNVHVIKGAIPDSFDQGEPEGEIAFLHIDMNNAAAELAALERLFDKVVTGAVIVFDDYGWNGYREQKESEDAFFAERGLQILELPTGQGLTIK